ncbi:helix-turn-helix domain-containing protein [Hydrogenophaga taeniospiralis]|uniref:helix-turn-helix domain-containing protein n=1 Tax=Hydrogenophaga taeniospiralis TaxID=65656 RepID=UPI001CF992D9|nr:helix-turn-helix transcriptional regulator [Hydrogenophaga taeniospiralis]UCU93352.1 helix-turn-helix transcriptional regulator [Hydrogenophaga taeniospiralis]
MMKKNTQHFFTILDGLGARLKDAREAQGFSQKDLAAAGGVTRFTQAGYENEATEPNTGYLKSIQETGIDLHYILTGRRQEFAEKNHVTATAINWERLRAAYEDVDFFCQRLAPSCPSKYRWQMVAELYSSDVKLGTSAPLTSSNSDKSTMTFLTRLWSGYV